MALTGKESRFAEEYLIDLNATQAAVRAGYSAKTAHQIGARLLQKAEVAEAITAARAARSQRTEITADRVLRELALIAFQDIGAAFDEKGQLLAINAMPEEARRTLAGFEVTARSVGEGQVEFVSKIRHADKLGALTQLGRHLGLFTDKSMVVDETGKAMQPVINVTIDAGPKT